MIRSIVAACALAALLPVFGDVSDRVTWENLEQFAASNVKMVKEPVKGIVVDHHGLGCRLFRPEKPGSYGKGWAEDGIVFVHPHTNPWGWMNDQAIAMTDEILDVIIGHYKLPKDVKVLSSGGSMGGLGALVWTRYTKHHVVACSVNCPVCDLEYHATERADVLRTLKSAFGTTPDFAEAVRRHSPLRLAAELPDIPYFFVHAERDTAVNKGAHSDKLVPLLESHGRKVRYVTSVGHNHCELTAEAKAALDCANRAVFGLAVPFKLSPLFAKGMVLAKDQPVRVFGAGSGEIAVTLGGKTVRTVARDGLWCAELPAMKAGGPYVLEAVGGGVTQKIEDVRVGTVILVAGQSNMQFKLKESTTPKAEWKGDPLLRSFSSPRVAGTEPHTPEEGWVACTDEDAGNWSAIGYHVGKEIRARTGEAVGVVNCYQGASTIQSWLPVAIADAPQYVLPREELFGDHFEKAYASFNAHGILYEKSFRPLAPYALSAVAWYQGESNTGTGEPKIYAQLVAELVKCWRADLRQSELPFVVVQIADTRKSEGWLGIQAAQMKVPELVPHVKTVRSGDVCEPKGIHPPSKAALSKRIADAILPDNR